MICLTRHRRSRRAYLLGLMLWLMVFCPLPSKAAKQETTTALADKQVLLFDTLEFRGSLKALAGWTNLVEEARRQITNFQKCEQNLEGCQAPARNWLLMLSKARKLNNLEQLKFVNHFFNRWPYRLDLEVYGQSDYWATPQEFMRLSGDCEDYAISKYFALRQLGYPVDALRIVIVKDQIRNLGHAILVVYMTSQAIVLDNMSDLIITQKHYSHYQPQYSLNEESRWAHIRKYRKNTP